MLGILGNLEKDGSYDAIKSIVNDIHFSDNDDLDKSRYFKQLRILAQLRLGVEQQILKAMEGIGSFFREENDIYYRKGARVARHSIVENLILKAGFTDGQAADVADVSIEFVKQVRAELELEKK